METLKRTWDNPVGPSLPGGFHHLPQLRQSEVNLMSVKGILTRSKCHSKSDLFSALSCPTETEPNSPQTRRIHMLNSSKVEQQSLTSRENAFIPP